MGLSIGIVGLPNVGKSTLFNALTRAQNAESANYPFCTIEPNKAIVSVPDERLDILSRMAESEKKISAVVEFVDIAGLVRGASKGEGLGNQFLANIKETDVILQVVRCFNDDQVIHVDGSVNAMRDIEIIETELILADFQSLENRLPSLIKLSRGDKSLLPVVEMFKLLISHLGEGNLASSFLYPENKLCSSYLNELQLLTNKPFIYCCNVDENSLNENKNIKDVYRYVKKNNSSLIKICVKMEDELKDMNDEERNEFLAAYDISHSSLDQIVKTGYDTLGLISYFTQGPKESRAWTINKGDLAPKAAGKIHTDFERGFIRAQVMSYNDFIKYNGEQGCKDAGVLRTEGKDYEVKDGDVVEFLFNV